MSMGFMGRWLMPLMATALLPMATFAVAQDALDSAAQDDAAVAQVSEEEQFRYEEQWTRFSDAGDHERAAEIATTWVADAIVQFGDDAPEIYEPLLRQAASLEAGGQALLAAKAYGEAIKIAERRMGPFARELVDPLVGLGRVLADAGDHEAAVSNFMRAKNITHRNEGIFNPDQTPIVDQLTDSYESLGEARQATREQRFLFGTQEKLVGRNSVDFVPALQKWAKWNARLQRFPDARRYFGEAIKILEDHYGPNDVRLIETLNMIAQSYYDNPVLGVQRDFSPVFPREGGRALARVVEIYESQEFVDQADVMVAQGRLADWNMIVGRHTRAIQTYEQAIADARAAGVEDEYIDRVYGAPRILTHSAIPFGIWPRLQERFEDGPKSVIVEFDIGPRGKARNIRVVLDELNLVKVLQTIRARVGGTAYRPRFVDGKAVTTYGMRQRYDFSNEMRAPKVRLPVMPEQEP